MNDTKIQDNLVKKISAKFPEDFYDRKFSTYEAANEAAKGINDDVTFQDRMYGGYLSSGVSVTQMNLDGERNQCIVIDGKQIAKLILDNSNRHFQWEKLN